MDIRTASLPVLARRALALAVDLAVVVMAGMVAALLLSERFSIRRDGDRSSLEPADRARVEEIDQGFNRAIELGDTLYALSGFGLFVSVLVVALATAVVLVVAPGRLDGRTPGQWLVGRFLDDGAGSDADTDEPLSLEFLADVGAAADEQDESDDPTAEDEDEDAEAPVRPDGLEALLGTAGTGDPSSPDDEPAGDDPDVWTSTIGEGSGSEIDANAETVADVDPGDGAWPSDGDDETTTPWTSATADGDDTTTPWTSATDDDSETTAPWTSATADDDETTTPWTSAADDDSETTAPWTSATDDGDETTAPWTSATDDGDETTAPRTSATNDGDAWSSDDLEPVAAPGHEHDTTDGSTTETAPSWAADALPDWATADPTDEEPSHAAAAAPTAELATHAAAETAWPSDDDPWTSDATDRGLSTATETRSPSTLGQDLFGSSPRSGHRADTLLDSRDAGAATATVEPTGTPEWNEDLRAWTFWNDTQGRWFRHDPELDRWLPVS